MRNLSLTLVFALLLSACTTMPGDMKQDPNGSTDADQKHNAERDSRPLGHEEGSLDHPAESRPDYKPDEILFSERTMPNKRVTRDDFVDQSQEEGSLWAPMGQTNYFFSKNRVRTPGDIVTLKLEEDSIKHIERHVKETLTAWEEIKEITDIKLSLQLKQADAEKEKQQRDVASAAQAAPANKPTNVTTTVTTNGNVNITPPTTQDYNEMIQKVTRDDIKLFESLDVKAGDTMVGQITQRYPNGNYKVHFRKRVYYKKGAPRIIDIIGIVKPNDISDDTDTIISGKMYESQTAATRT